MAPHNRSLAETALAVGRADFMSWQRLGKQPCPVTFGGRDDACVVGLGEEKKGMRRSAAHFTAGLISFWKCDTNISTKPNDSRRRSIAIPSLSLYTGGSP